MIDRILRYRWLPLACGAFAFVVVLYVWGSLDKIAVGNDEMAYLLQSRIFASGQLVAERRPMPEFFQQYHVFVDPVLAAKYPPGHSLLLTLGIWVGLPGLVPALLVSVTAAVLCAVTRRLTNGGVAVLAVWLAITSDIALRFDASYFSETTTAAVFVLAWWTLLEYWTSGRRRWLLALAATVAWGGITRPYTMLAFCIPAGIAGFMAIARHRAWSHAAQALVLAGTIGALLPIWNARVTGNWRTMTQSEYARLYLPSDRLGFGGSTDQPAAHLSPEGQAAAEVVRRMHAAYTPGRLLDVMAARAAAIVSGTWAYGGLTCLALLLGVTSLPVGVSRVLIITLLSIFIAYLAYAHDPQWTLYYLEFQPPLALLTAVGVYQAARWVANVVQTRMSAAMRWTIEPIVFAGLTLALVVPGVERIAAHRHEHGDARLYREKFERAVAALPGKTIVFVQYAAGHGEQRLVDNVVDLESARTWTVHDCGAQNASLVALAPQRRPYVYHDLEISDHGAGALLPLDRPESTSAAGVSLC